MTSHGRVKYSILGPLRVDGESGSIELDAPKQRLLLAMLLVSADRPVPADTLYVTLWPDDRPAQPRKALAWHILRLRQLLGGKETIAWVGDGYQLAAVSGEIDADRFTRLLRTARERLDTDPAAADRLLDEALDLWRGPALAEFTATGRLRDEAARLDELRLSALECRGDARLALGGHSGLVAELRDRVDEHPFRERFLAQLMLALYRDGRRDEALQAFAEARTRFADSLGLDPSPSLCELERRVARADPALDPDRPEPVPVPRQLPADIASFTGRSAEVEALTKPTQPHGSNTIALSVIDGMGGVGKTTLAVHVAHRLAADYPDGQLFIDLRGYSGDTTAVPVAAALERLLRALGVTGDRIPDEPDERSALLRSVMSGRRMLMLLDNAVSEAQVRPLLPGGGHRVIVTARNPLAGLDEARRVSLRVLDPTAAAALFARVAGIASSGPDRTLVAEIVELCGRLPLAVRIAASRLRAAPHWTLSELRRRLADDGRRVTELRLGTRQLEATFRLSVRELDERQRRAFRLLTAAPLLDFGTEAAAIVLDLPVDDTDDLLAELVDARLLEYSGADRYDFHDLVRLYGRQSVDEAERFETAVRLGDWFVDTARAAKARVNTWSALIPHHTRHHVTFKDYDTAQRWFDTELPSLLNFLRQDRHRPDQLWTLVDAVGGYFKIRHIGAEQREAIAIGLDAAVRCGNPAAEAAMRGQLGEALRRAADFDESLRQQHAALRLAREADDHHRVAHCLLEVAAALEFRGDTVEAIAYARRAYTESVEYGVGNPIAALDILGCCHQLRGELRRAAAVNRLAVHRKRLVSSTSIQNTLGNLSMVYCDMGRLAEAREMAVEALRLSREHDSPNAVRANLDNLARVDIAVGDIPAALRNATEALRIGEEIGAIGSRPFMLSTLALAHLAERPGESLRLAQEGVTLARRSNSALSEAEALMALAESHLALGDPGSAREPAVQARRLAVDREFQVVAGRAVTVLAEAALADGDVGPARELAREAAEIQRRTGCRPGRDRALRCLLATEPVAVPPRSG